MKVCRQNPRRVGSLFEAVFACALRHRAPLFVEPGPLRQFSRHSSRSSVLVKTQ